MQLRSLFCVAAAAAVAACATAAPPTDSTADKTAIEKVRGDYTAAFNAGNATGLAGLYASDGNAMNNAVPTAAGPQAIEAANKAMMGSMTSQNIVITSDQLEVSGDIAYDRGTYKTTVTPKGGAAMTETGRYLVILKRQADGSWKIVDAMGNLATAPVALAAPGTKKK